jgi:hypothetical protein
MLSVYGLARVIGVGFILLLGIYGGLLSQATGLTPLVVFQLLNTAMLFLIVTIMYEWAGRRAP